MAVTKTVIDNSLSAPDGFSARDITGNGFKDLLVANEGGQVYWYEQTAEGSFTQHTIFGSTVAGAKYEGALWIDINGDGDFEAAILDQKNDRIRMFKPTSAGVYTGTWSSGDIITTRAQLQDAIAFDIDADGKEELIFAFEGENDVADGGVHWLDWNSGDVTSSSSYTEYVMCQEVGSWWVDGPNVDGDFVFSARTNGRPNPGVFIAERPSTVTDTWTKTRIESENRDWLHVYFGNWFGNGHNQDVLAHAIDGTLRAYDFNNSYSATTITTDALRAGHNIMPHYGARNSRQKFVTFGYSPGQVADVYVSEYYWTGSAWAVREETIGLQDKMDDVVAFLDLDSVDPLEIVGADSTNNELLYLTFTHDTSESSAAIPPTFSNVSSVSGVTSIIF